MDKDSQPFSRRELTEHSQPLSRQEGLKLHSRRGLWMIEVHSQTNTFCQYAYLMEQRFSTSMSGKLHFIFYMTGNNVSSVPFTVMITYESQV